PKTFDLIESLSATLPETVWRAHGVGKKAFSFLRIWKNFFSSFSKSPGDECQGPAVQAARHAVDPYENL
ncbi:hypothetical protein, partial [Bilophila wadsworthia]|uniref:hypothetical protein n=1 Tax=Bilophila wadsworthia TaxID=35833 RepID=UPI00307F6073